MEITEVRIKLMEDSDDRLQAFCSITFDDAFVVRDLKIIEGSSGPFVAMPSRKLTAHCPQCHCKNHLRATYCNQCGLKQNSDRASRDSEGRAKLYADIAHPINSACREMIQTRVISEYQHELERAKQPGYKSRYDDDYDDAGPEELHDSRTAGTTSRVDTAAAAQPAPHVSPAPSTSPPSSSSGNPPRDQQGPHRPPPQSRATSHTQPQPEQQPQQKPKGDFGAGIF